MLSTLCPFTFAFLGFLSPQLDAGVISEHFGNIMTTSWQKRRSEFNHDWLKNRYLPALAKWINILDDRVDDPEFQRRFPKTILNQWREYGPQARLLAETFETDMSPRILLESCPLSDLPLATREWLGQTIHALWLSRYPVRQWIAETVAAADAANSCYLGLREAIDSKAPSTLPELRSLRPAFASFQGLCQALARMVELLPPTILIS